MDDADGYLKSLKKSLVAWDDVGEDVRQAIWTQGMKAGDGAKGDILRIGILTLDLLHTREISISKLSIETVGSSV